ncbi:site-specific integrase [Treponema sp. TIM-1]|uniref:tyrosine-type recombinase/integrase n=1 Tax=Treponema sp. TIM-1 TaxID=2898417 RepID=UPI00397FD3A7
MSSGEGFVAYLYRFWDWNGHYVQDRLERGERIGRRYVDCCKTRIKLHIEPYFKDILLCDVTTVLLEQFMRSFPRRDIDPKNGFSKSTINQVMKVIKKPLKEAVRLRILPRNPADGITMLREDTQERGILTPAELEGLFRIEWLDERSKIASILVSISGLRISEVTALRLDDIDTRRNTIFIRNLSFHGFRHFFNSTIRGTVSDDILRLQTGHLDEKMTDHYDHMTDDRGEQLRKAVQAKILSFIPMATGEKKYKL